jgi:hypothetical protein
MASMQPYSKVEAGDMIIRNDGSWRVKSCYPHPSSDGTYLLDMTPMNAKNKQDGFVRVQGSTLVKVL